ncbi:hypothetical protein ANO11243_052700 [Dothideomycetidae sp. 11243]|nr:hypothetical protein ANO11243_052700 [fungal sp. No.11243]
MLLHCCSQSGYEEATLDLGISYQKHAAVNRRDYLQARDQVHRLAEEGNLRAASLEAELAESDNGSKVAIPLWERALNIARDQETVDRPGASRFSYLEKPWIRLAVLKFQTDHQGANAALRVGMVKDDPDAYYAFAKLNHDRRHDSKQFFLEWINAVTKSAAGGSFRSAIALADHYANEAATDLTEFLNAKETSHAWWPNWFERARVSHMSPANAEQDDRMTGLGARTSQYHSQVAAFASAARTPVDRMHMAIRWLRVATEQGLVEAILKLAVLHSRRFIFQAHNLEMKIKHPAEQTDIDINDYFGFEADLAEAEPTLSNTFAAPNDHVKEFVWRKGTVNPFYNPAMVASLLGDAFHCFAWINTTRNREQSAALSLANLKVAPRWYTFPDITALNEENSDRNLSQTMGIADELGVDLVYVDGEEKVVRKHTGVRGQGMWEFDHPKEEKARNVQFVE